MPVSVGGEPAVFTLKDLSENNWTFDQAASELQGRVVLLSFIDITRDLDWKWLKCAEEEIPDDPGALVRVAVIYHRTGGNDPTHHGTDSMYSAWIAEERDSVFAITPASTSIWLQYNNTAMMADLSIRQNYIDQFDTGFEGPGIFVIRKVSTGVDFTVVDAFHYASPDSGNGVVSGAWKLNDLVDFGGWSGYSPAMPPGFPYPLEQKLFKILQYVKKRTDDLRDSSRIARVANPNVSWVTDGSSLTFSFHSVHGPDSFSKKALGAWDPDGYLLDGLSAHMQSVTPLKLTVDRYLNDSAGESRTVVLRSDITADHRGQHARFSPDPLKIIDSNGLPFQFEGGAAPAYEVLENAGVPYLRDNLETDMGYPHDGALSCSPDIILRQAEVPPAQVQADLGDASANRYDLSDDVRAGRDNSLYVRAYNRGAQQAAAGSTKATVYWAEASTLITPANWNLIGSQTFTLAIPAARQHLVVTPVIPWPQGQVPPAGHYCFIATLVGAAEDPAAYKDSLASLMTTIQGYYGVVRSESRLTWRNFNVVNLAQAPLPLPHDPNPLPDHWGFPFRFPAAPGKKVPLQLQVIAALPAGPRMNVDIPVAMLKTMSDWKRMKPVQTVDHARFAMGEGRVLLFPDAALPPGSSPTIWLRVPRIGAFASGRYGVVVRQMWKGREVGRITWLHRPLKPSLAAGYHRIAAWQKEHAERK